MFGIVEIYRMIVMIIPLIFAVTVHEVAHGVAALRMGDPTARDAGRLTLNPIRHLDPFGSFLLPLLLRLGGSPVVFGYAKPVPVNPGRFRDFTAGTLAVSSAGVIANFILAFASGALFQALLPMAKAVSNTGAVIALHALLSLLGYSVLINTILGIFNLVPVPPLDGSRIVAVLLPPSLRRPYVRLERYGMFLLFGLLLTGVVDRLFDVLIEPMLLLFLGQNGLRALGGL